MEIGQIKQRPITKEMQESYLDYAMSVIISRALPDVRDGLKPVHRRILYTMWNMGLKSNAKFRKSAAVVGDCLGKYHPHGDIAVYDSLVRMAQDFAMNHPLVNGQGNFGSIDGDAPAAQRYTEARLSKIAEELLFDLEKETVKFVDNYDGTTKEPSVLPAKLPNMLLNGTMGIAVGMATNIPPHNLSEVVDGLIYLIDHPKATVENLTKYIKGPDFPTGGIIFNKKDINQVYTHGKGSIVMRGVASISEKAKGLFDIVITEIPYQINKAALIEKIAEQVKNKKLEGIKDIRDESDKEGIRIVIELRRGVFPKKILNRIYALTSLQEKFHANMVALADGIQPQTMNLKMICQSYIDHRKKVVTRRCQFDLARAEERAHILSGLKKALDHLNAVIRTIKQSKDRDTALKNLINKFKFTEIQANAILEMKLSQLAKLEREKIEDEFREKKKLIKDLKEILASPKKILGVIKKELKELKEKYGRERRTKIVDSAVHEFTPQELIPKESIVIILTRGGYIKSISESTWKTQRRGGRGVIGMGIKEEDIVRHFIVCSTHSNLLFFTNTGKVFQLKAYEIPKSERITKGQSIINFLQLSSEEKITALVSLDDFKMAKFLFMATKNGLVKKVKIEDFSAVRKSGLMAIRLKQGDELRWVRPTTGQQNIILVTAFGQAIRFSETNVRPMGRMASGVCGIKLKEGDWVVSALVVEAKPKKQEKLLVVTEFSFGKQTLLSHYHRQRRGGRGIKTAKVTDKNGRIVSALISNEQCKELIIVSSKCQVIKIPINNIPQQGRLTQGVRIMRIKAGDKIASAACV